LTSFGTSWTWRSTGCVAPDESEDDLSRAWTGTGMWLRFGGVAVAGLLVIGWVGVPASPAGATSHPVRVGRAPQPGPGTVKLAPLPRTTEIRVDVSLQPRDPAALAAYAKGVSTPGSDLYRHYLAPGAFAGEFGPTQQAIATVEQALRAAGLRPGRISGNHLSIPVKATAAQLSAAFSTGFQQYQVDSGRVAYANDAAPLISDSAAPYVQGVVGLNDLYVPTPAGASRPSLSTGPTSVKPAATPAGGSDGPQPCPTAVSDGATDDAYTANQLAAAYGFTSLYSAGDLGAGQTVALLEFAGYSTSDISAYESCYGEHTSITTVNTDGGPAAKSSVGEADGDIEDVSGLAPDANIVVYQAPNTNSGWFDNWNAAVSQDAAKVISISWGLCEAFDGTAPQQENTILEQAAAQGQTFLASAGDAGSEDCLGPHGENGYLAVDDPAAQPYVTGVGGSQWTSTGTPPTETAWNDGVLQCNGSADCFGAGGGGISENWPMPDYQAGADPSVGVVSGDSSGSPCGAPAGQYCREVPDVSALAGPYPFLFYITGGWEDWGGTSFASPLWAALIALADASSVCNGETIGFANPTLYSIAGSDSASPRATMTSPVPTTACTRLSPVTTWPPVSARRTAPLFRANCVSAGQRTASPSPIPGLRPPTPNGR
jgi:subtilase family serine protease